MPIGPMPPVVSPARALHADGGPIASGPPSSQRFGAYLAASPSPGLRPGAARDPAAVEPFMPVARALAAQPTLASAIATADVSLAMALPKGGEGLALRATSAATEDKIQRTVPSHAPHDRMSHTVALRV